MREAAIKEEILLKEEKAPIPIPKPAPLPPVLPPPPQPSPQENEIYGANGPKQIVPHSCCYILDHENPCE